MPTPPPIRYTGRDFSTLREELENYVKLTRPDLWSDFHQSNLGQTLLELVAGTGDMLAYGEDAVLSEAYLSTAQRYESGLRVARSVGYVPRAAKAASVTLNTTSIPSIVQSQGAMIAAGETIDGPGDAVYELEAAVYIGVGSTTASVTLSEGRSFSETFDGSGQPGQEITLSNAVVEDGSWKVYVGGVSADNLWAQVASVAQEQTESNVYEVAFDGEGRLTLRFGGDTGSSAAPVGTVTVRYRTTAGSDGNAPINTITGTFEAEVGVELDSGGNPIPGSGSGSTASIALINDQAPASGGQDRESLASLKRSIPAYIRSVDKLISLNDYATLTQATGVALATAHASKASYEGNHVDVSVWADERVTFASEALAGGDGANADYTRYAQLSAGSVGHIRDYIQDRALLSTTHAINRPGTAWVDLYLHRVLHDNTRTDAELHQDIVEAVIEVFEGGTGFALRLSDVYDAIESVGGVRSGFIDRMVVDQDELATLKFSGQPADGDILSLLDAYDAAPVVYEFDSNSSVVAGRVPVEIGASLRETLYNFVRAVEANSNIEAVLQTDSAASPQLVRLEWAAEWGYIVDEISVTSSAITVVDPAGAATDIATFRFDRRRDQSPPYDAYPPVAGEEYEPGKYDPPSSLSSGGGSNAGWQSHGVLPYRHLDDVIAGQRDRELRYYDETYLYNNEIRYDSILGINEVTQAVNMRRLVVGLLPDRR